MYKNRNHAPILGLSVIAKAQFKTELYLTDLPDEALQEKVQQNISKLLTAMNNADAAQTSLDYTGIQIAQAARKTLDAMWAGNTYRCGDTEIVERCLTTPDNRYQVRNIPLFTKGVGEKTNIRKPSSLSTHRESLSIFTLPSPPICM